MSTWASIAAASLKEPQHDEEKELSSSSERVAIVDATAMIKGFLPMTNQVYDRICTVKEVFDEVRDKAARTRLRTLPYKVETVEPDPEALKTVVEFASETGDLYFLSTADIKLIALVFDFEKQCYGTEHLDLNPKKVANMKSQSAGKQPELPGWGQVPNPADWEFLDNLNTTEADQHSDENQTLENADPVVQIVEQTKGLSKTVTADDGWTEVPKRTKQPKQKPRRYQDESIDDIGQADNAAHDSQICCLSGDFGIQNVLLQIGLKLVTPDGVRIRHLTKWGLKCASCFYTTKKSGKVFCPNCGNSTLFKVRIEIDENGVEVFGGLSKPQQRRGARCSIPPPKGGKKNKDAIVSEDMMHQTMERFRNQKSKGDLDVFAPEYDEDTWFKRRTVKNQIKDQLPGRFGYPRFMSKQIPQRRKH